MHSSALPRGARSLEGTSRGARRTNARKCSTRWSSVFSSTRRANCFRSGIGLPKAALDPNCYDLLASEARLASFVAIAKGDVPTRHWFRLGRTETPVGWRFGTGLMVRIDVRVPDAKPGDARAGREPARAHQPLRRRRQIEYGAELGLPWGVSESAYNVRDLELTYQYSSFGVPGLGLKRGLSQNAVIAPYATALAAMVDPQAAARNFSRLAAAGGRGRYGWYEALDYTPARLPEGAEGRDRPLLYGASSGDDPGRDRQRSPGRRDAHPLSRRADYPGDRAFAAGTNSARCAVAHPRAEEVKADGQRSRTGSADAAPVPISAPADSPYSPALQRQVRGDDHRGRLRIQPLAGSAVTRWREDATCDSLGHIHLPARRAAAARCGRRATSQAESSRIVTRRVSLRIEPKSSGTTARSATTLEDGGLAGGRR